MTGRHRGARSWPGGAGQEPAPAGSQADPGRAGQSSHPHPDPVTVVSSAADLDGRVLPGALVEWVIRFAQSPEQFPAFLAGARDIWPGCPLSDAEIAAQLTWLHDLFARMLAAGG